jgi:hypothetical protein
MKMKTKKVTRKKNPTPKHRLVKKGNNNIDSRQRYPGAYAEYRPEEHSLQDYRIQEGGENSSQTSQFKIE